MKSIPATAVVQICGQLLRLIPVSIQCIPCLLYTSFPEKAASILAGAGYRASVTPVIGVKVPNRPGGLASLLEYCDQCGLNIEYGYCYSVNGEYALEVLKVDSPEAEATLGDGGFETVSADEVYDY